MYSPIIKAVLSAALLGSSLVSALPVSINAELETRQELAAARPRVCNADNLLRLLRTPTNLPEALPFCSSYLALEASTTTVATVTPTVTLVQQSLVTVTEVVTNTVPVVELTSVTRTINVRNAVKTPLAQRVTETYDASRISSACGCLTIPVEVASVTATAADATQTQVVVSTVTDSTTETVFTSVTSVVGTATVTSTTSLPCPTSQFNIVEDSFIPNGPRNITYLSTSYRPSNFTRVQQGFWNGNFTSADTFGLTPEGYLRITGGARASGASGAVGFEKLELVAFAPTAPSSGSNYTTVNWVPRAELSRNYCPDGPCRAIQWQEANLTLSANFAPGSKTLLVANTTTYSSPYSVPARCANEVRLYKPNTVVPSNCFLQKLVQIPATNVTTCGY